MKKLTKAILVLSLAFAAGCVSVPKVNNAPVAALDLNRYLGEWYEVARFDHSFERGIEQARAKYALKDDGTIEIVNSGVKDGKPKTAVGKGKTTDTPALLRVSFFGPFYADYRVMMIDNDYTYALVGSGGYQERLGRHRAVRHAPRPQAGTGALAAQVVSRSLQGNRDVPSWRVGNLEAAA